MASMELTLTRQADGPTVDVACNGQPSHPFDLSALIPGHNGLPQPLADPIAYGKAIFQALFPDGTAARQALDAAPERILLVALHDELDAVPWEYAYRPDGSSVDDFVVLECPFVRGLPAEQRIDPPALESGLHIVVVPSNPLDKRVEPLNIDGEWMNLKESIQEIPYAISLERARPPTIEQLRRLVAGQRQRVVHFMGHGGQDEQVGAFLCFEREDGALEAVTAQQFVRRVRNTVFLVTLNACVTAQPGETTFSNLASALAREKVPYALGMRFSIYDKDARAFSHSFYDNLARGVPVEEALLQARMTLARKADPWVVGVPVLYSALSAPAAGFACQPGEPTVEEHQPPIEATGLPRAEGVFQGRIEELVQLGSYLTGDSRQRLVTIHGSGGQGKTALAHEAVERFAHAWPGGVWSISLENLPSRAVFLNALARFLGLAFPGGADLDEIERQIVSRLSQRRTLIVLDNAETLVEAVNADNEAARELAQCIRHRLSAPGVPTVGLLATSRAFLGWDGEVGLARNGREHDLEGLEPQEGAKLFRHAASRRADEIDLNLAARLSEKVGGHPLSLRLLAGTFKEISLPLADFLKDCDRHLLEAENKYLGLDHRHRTFYACIDTSVRYLSDDQRTLLSRLWLFHAPFLPEYAVAIFDPESLQNTESEEAGTDIEGAGQETRSAESTQNTEGEEPEKRRSPIYDQLYKLADRSLLAHETADLREGSLRYYRLLPAVHTYIERFLAHDKERDEERASLLARFGAAYASLARYLYDELDRGSAAAFIATLCVEDLERGLSSVSGVDQGYYLLHWGWILERLGDTRHGLELTEQALEIGQEQNQQLLLQALNNLAGVYRAIGQPERALALYEQALPIRREVRDRAGEATTLSNLALVYRAIGQPERALALYEQALPITREVRDRAGEAATLNGLAYLLWDMQQYVAALEAFEQSITIAREILSPAAEVAGLVGASLLLYRHLNRKQEAVASMERAIAVLEKTGLPQDAAGHTVEKLQQYLAAMRQGQPFGQASSSSATLPAEQLRVVVANTVAVMTTVQERRAEWRETITGLLQDAQQRGADWRIEVEFYTAILALLDGQPATLPAEHPYAPAWKEIVDGIAAGGVQGDEGDESDEEGEELPFDEELIRRSIVALLGGPPEKMAHMQYLTELSKQVTDEEVKALIETIQLALVGGNLAQLGRHLEGVYRAAWETMVQFVETGGVDPRLLTMMVQNTRAVLGPAAGQRAEWREYLVQLRAEMAGRGADELVKLIDAVLALLEAGGKADGLGTNLTGAYARAWDAIVK